MESFFCDQCSRRVTEGDLAEGRAVRVGDLCFCRECSKTAEVQSFVARSSGGADRAAPVTARPPTPSRQRASRAKTPGRAAVRRSPHRGLPRARPTAPGAPTRRTPHGHRRTPVPARPRGPGTFALVALCVILGMGLGLLVMYLYASRGTAGASRRAPVPITTTITTTIRPDAGPGAPVRPTDSPAPTDAGPGVPTPRSARSAVTARGFSTCGDFPAPVTSDHDSTCGPSS